jgi:putative peptidoglycan lipid II flippase
LTRIMLLSPILLALAAVASSVLNARGRFGAAAIAPSVYNIAIIVAALVLGPIIGVEALAIGVVFGSLLHLGIQVVPVIRERFHLSFDIDLSDSSSRQVLLLMAPRALGLGANQVTFVVATMLATGIGVGAVTSYNIAWTLMQIPLGVIGFPLGIVLLPSLSRAVASGSAREFGRMIVGSVRLLLWIMLFVTGVGIVVRRQVVNMLFVGLDDHAQSLTADTLSFLLLGLAAYSLVIVFARAFYSGHDTRTPVITSLFDMVTSIVIGLATVGTLGLSGVALGLSCGAFAEAAALGVLLWRRTPGTGLESVIRPFFVFAIGAIGAAIVAALVVRVTDPLIGPDPGRLMLLAQVAVASAAAALVYIAYTRLLRIPELQQTIDIARSFVRRRGGGSSGSAGSGGDSSSGAGGDV